ncbi:phosphotransferase family protein [Streptosporangium sp. NBC_01755]|uniref:phosphotransferase family protein n=1 Tax=unclassified Streptosporangium TaxID=2632669 RepID=UPI002DDC7CE4|nr:MULTISPECIES: phosphotransferase family protein [unclassified Streptosporangium]WSA28480.1 phosphotransferase family protein [Streptosporangium sp. NBC_01810]WSD00029.1 phosphotransferase family protein [Streptosporangium sp. NBC_01755]
MTGSLPGLDLPALQQYFDLHVPEASGPISADLVHGGRSNLTYRLSDGRTSWVLRRPPLGGLTPSAHDVAREYRVVAALYGSGVPVARAVALCEDPSVLGCAFSLVEYVSGAVVRSREDLDRYGPAELARCAHGLIEVLAALHAVPYGDVGLSGFGRPEGFLARQVGRWSDQWQRVATRELRDIDALRGRLAETTPATGGAAVVHGDFRIDNAIFADDDLGTMRALVDWEMATLGDPLTDLALHLVYRDPAFEPVLAGSAASTSERLPAPEDLAERYARVSGRDLGRLDFYLALGYFKIAVIAEGIYARHRQGLTVGEGFDTVGAAVPQLAAAGLRALNRKTATA